MQSSRVSITIGMIVATPRPGSPTGQARASQNSTSEEALDQSPSLSFSRISRNAFFDPSGSRRGSRKQPSPSGVCASTRKPSDIGAEKNHLCPTSCQASPPGSGVAVVALPRTSEPPCFSVMPMPRVSPAFSAIGRSRGS